MKKISLLLIFLFFIGIFSCVDKSEYLNDHDSVYRMDSASFKPDKSEYKINKEIKK